MNISECIFIYKLWVKDSYFGAACIREKRLGSLESMMASYKTLLTIGLEYHWHSGMEYTSYFKRGIYVVYLKTTH